MALKKTMAAFLLFAGTSGAVAETIAPVPEALLIQGREYSAACSTVELARLKAETQKLAAGHNPDNAWELARTMLCGEGKSAEQFLRQHAPKRIVSRSSGTGEEDTKEMIPWSNSLLAKKQAWGATLSYPPSTEIGVSYYSDEACVSSFTLRFDGRNWMLVGVGQGCD